MNSLSVGSILLTHHPRYYATVASAAPAGTPHKAALAYGYLQSVVPLSRRSLDQSKRTGWSLCRDAVPRNNTQSRAGPLGVAGYAFGMPFTKAGISRTTFAKLRFSVTFVPPFIGWPRNDHAHAQHCLWYNWRPHMKKRKPSQKSHKPGRVRDRSAIYGADKRARNASLPVRAERNAAPSRGGREGQAQAGTGSLAGILRSDVAKHPRGDGCVYLSNGHVAWEVPQPAAHLYSNRLYLPPPGWVVLRGKLGVTWQTGELGELRNTGVDGARVCVPPVRGAMGQVGL